MKRCNGALTGPVANRLDRAGDLPSSRRWEVATKNPWKLTRMLMKAIQQKDLAGVQKALDQGANPNVPGTSFDGGLFPPLCLAASTLHPQLVELLLARGADVTLATPIGMTALHCSRDPETMALLLNAPGADPNVRGLGHCTPLHTVADKRSAQLLIESGADIDALNEYMQTPEEVIEDLLVRQREEFGPSHWINAKGEEAIAYLAALRGGDRLAEATAPVAMSAEAQTDEAQKRRV